MPSATVLCLVAMGFNSDLGSSSALLFRLGSSPPSHTSWYSYSA